MNLFPEIDRVRFAILIWRNTTIEYEDILAISPFSLDKRDKCNLLSEKLSQLTILHFNKCAEYKRILDATGINLKEIHDYYDVPFIPVSLFKEFDLKSINRSEIFKTMTSSGTTGQTVSKIVLDKRTAINQQKTLIQIVADFIGSSRMPMLIIDSPSVVRNRAMLSARGAGILGFSIFGSERAYALDDDMQINEEVVKAFLAKHHGRAVLLFGFTFMVWQHFYKELIKMNDGFDLSKGVLIHGGGWKKLASESVSREEFSRRLEEICGLQRVHDYYGMVEQTGCVYMECEYGHLHASIFSDIITRRFKDFSPCDIGEPGVIQVVSMLPESYPGHSLLTEDEGEILGEDDCPCGRLGKYFQIHGRLKDAEIRGCSDTYAVKPQ